MASIKNHASSPYPLTRYAYRKKFLLKGGLEDLLEKMRSAHPQDKLHELRIFLSDHGIGIIKGPSSFAHFKDMEAYHVFSRGIKFRIKQDLLKNLDNMERGKDIAEAGIARSFMYKIKNFLSTGKLKDSFGEITFKGANRIEIAVEGRKISGTIEHTLEYGDIYVFDKLDNLFVAGKHIAQ